MFINWDSRYYEQKEWSWNKCVNYEGGEIVEIKYL
jgi:hypothetical protein